MTGETDKILRGLAEEQPAAQQGVTNWRREFVSARHARLKRKNSSRPDQEPLARKRRAASQLDRPVRRLLAQVGAVEWGSSLLFIPRFRILRPGWHELKRMTFTENVESSVTWIVQHVVKRRRGPGGGASMLQESYLVRLHITPEGEPDHFSAEGATEVDSKTPDLAALGKALGAVMRVGPMIDWHYQ